MFALTDTPVKFIGLVVLFLFSTAWSLFQLSNRQTWPTLVSNIAHLAMSFVMLAMVPGALWQPLASIVGVPVLVGSFGVATVWFVGLGVRGLGTQPRWRQPHGWHAVGHAGMFGAMTGHLAAMLGHGAIGAGRIAVIGLPLMAYLAVSALLHLKNAVLPGPDLLDHACHELADHGHYAAGNPRLGALANFAMVFGMFWMSTGLLVPLLPVLGAL